MTYTINFQRKTLTCILLGQDLYVAFQKKELQYYLTEKNIRRNTSKEIDQLLALTAHCRLNYNLKNMDKADQGKSQLWSMGTEITEHILCKDELLGCQRFQHLLTMLKPERIKVSTPKLILEIVNNTRLEEYWRNKIFTDL